MPLSIAYRPYVLEMPSEDDFDGTALSLCVVVIKRDNGLILAVHQSFIPDEVLENAMDAGPDDASPLPREAEVDVILIPVCRWTSTCRSLYAKLGARPYVSSRPCHYVPISGFLVATAWEWIGQAGAESRVQFYTADEEEMVPECPIEDDEAADAEAPDPVGQVPNGPSSTQKGKHKPAKQTVASLASTLEGLAHALPALTMSELATRTQKMEDAMAGGQRSSALKQPLGSLSAGGSAQNSLPISALLQD